MEVGMLDYIMMGVGQADFTQLKTKHHERLKHNRSLRKSRSRHWRGNRHVSTYIIPIIHGMLMLL